MKKNSWVCTLITQISLCFALFLTLQIGRTQKPITKQVLDFYFISVRGGFRPLQEQSHFLKQVEKVIKAYKTRFVINISELGYNDPLNQNATRYFRSYNVPWYATKSSKEDEAHYFLKQVEAPNGNTLDVFFVNTGLFQDISSVRKNNQFSGLENALKSSNANWHIVAGVHPMIACNQTDQTEDIRTLYHIFLKHGVNAYISAQACSNSSGASEKGPYLTVINQRLNVNKSVSIHNEHDFLLHRVTSLEMLTYFVTLEGEVVNKILIRQLGREAM